MEVKWILNRVQECMKDNIPLGEMTILVRAIKNSAFIKLLIDEIK